MSISAGNGVIGRDRTAERPSDGEVEEQEEGVVEHPFVGRDVRG